jgi:serine/threonine-protein kinase RsbW
LSNGWNTLAVSTLDAQNLKMSGADNPKPASWELELESTLDSVDRAEQAVIETAEKAGLEEEGVYQLGYAVREAMVNAVVHGNHYSANKQVRLRVSSAGGRLEVVIDDQGAGFTFEGQADPLADENLMNQSGRGIMIIRAFVDELSLVPAPGGGTRITMWKNLPPAARE